MNEEILEKMDYCYSKLNERINYALDHNDLDSIFKKLDEINGPTLVTGVGGSSVVAAYVAKVMSAKKKDIFIYTTPRDLAHMDLSPYKNVIAVSYSGGNVGVTVSFENNLNKYLLSAKQRNNINNITYNCNPELSYLSVSATLIPMAIMLLYYKNDRSLIDEIIKETVKCDSNAEIYEVFMGIENKTASVALESSFVEGGLAPIILHDKYNYCHGRINLSELKKSDAIYFKEDSELDSVLLNGLPKHFNKFITIDRKYEDDIINEYYQTYIAYWLIYDVAKNKNKDVCHVIPPVDNDNYYLFKGKM